MAYARFGWNSDVYVYKHVAGGFICERCPEIGKAFLCGTAREMTAHLVGFHRARGDRVPDDAIADLEREEEET
jgi:hypothetical protein